MTRQPSRRRQEFATAAILGVTIALTSMVATAQANGSTASTAITVHRITVGGHPNGVAVDPRRRVAWVTTPQLVRISEVDPGTRFAYVPVSFRGVVAEFRY